MIEEIARMIGKDHPIVRKVLLRLEHGLTTPGEAHKLLGRLLKKEKGIDLENMGPVRPG